MKIRDKAATGNQANVSIKPYLVNDHWPCLLEFKQSVGQIIDQCLARTQSPQRTWGQQVISSGYRLYPLV